MSLVSLVEWNVSLGSADVSWGGGAKETTSHAMQIYNCLNCPGQL